MLLWSLFYLLLLVTCRAVQYARNTDLAIGESKTGALMPSITTPYELALTAVAVCGMILVSICQKDCSVSPHTQNRLSPLACLRFESKQVAHSNRRPQSRSVSACNFLPFNPGRHPLSLSLSADISEKLSAET